MMQMTRHDRDRHHERTSTSDPERRSEDESSNGGEESGADGWSDGGGRGGWAGRGSLDLSVSSSDERESCDEESHESHQRSLGESH